MTRLADALRDPIALGPNRIPRFYRGGQQIDEWRGSRSDGPEDWVGSATRAWSSPDAPPRPPLGVSEVSIGGTSTTLEDVLDAEPEALIGSALLERIGPSLGLLVKLLDAGERLPVHCHPTRPDAARLLGSPFGKTEAWIILGTVDGATRARVWAGLEAPVDTATWRRWIEAQSVDDMLGALRPHEVTVGDAILVPAGTPHAIGPGVFLLELQEPTDFSIVAERRGFPIAESDAALGLGWDVAVRCFATDPGPHDPVQAPSEIRPGVSRLLGHDADPYFRALRQRLDGTDACPFEPTFAVGIVLGGHGELHGTTRAVPLARGTTVALAAVAVATARIEGECLDVIWCLPPAAEALDASPLPEVRRG